MRAATALNDPAQRPAPTAQDGSALRSEFMMHRAAIWAGGLGSLAIMGIGFLGFARFVPPPSPAHSAERVAAIYADRSNAILFGLILSSFGAPLFGAFCVMISRHLKRIEGRWGILSVTQLMLGILVVLEFLVPFAMMMVPSFRPELPATTIQAFNDIAQILFVGLTETLVIQVWIIGAVILRDRRETPIMPRWLGLLNILLGTFWIASPFIVFFKTGPMAWNGLVLWWISLVFWLTWLISMTVALLKATNQEEQEAMAGTPVLGNDAWAEEILPLS